MSFCKRRGTVGRIIAAMSIGAAAITGSAVAIAAEVEPEANSLAIVSAADYRPTVALGSLVSIFGQDLATTTQAATDIDPDVPGVQLPTVLGGTSVTFVEANAPSPITINGQLTFVSPAQINLFVPFVKPNWTPVFGSTGFNVVVNNGDALPEQRGFKSFMVRGAPGIFSANSNGVGVAAANVVRVKADGSQRYERVAEYSEAAKMMVPVKIARPAPGERLFVELYGTGSQNWVGWFRSPTAGGAVRARAGLAESQLVQAYFGPAPGYVGVDQVNIELPSSLINAADSEIELWLQDPASRDDEYPTLSSNRVSLFLAAR